MLDKIVDGMIQKLNKAFGDDYKIYTESPQQGLQEPCFFIKLNSSTNTKQVGERYSRENLFCIQYFPESKDNPKIECYKMLDELYLAMEHIEVDGYLQQGIGMHGELVDGVLHFFVNYNMLVKKVIDRQTMEVLEVLDVRTKG